MSEEIKPIEENSKKKSKPKKKKKNKGNKAKCPRCGYSWFTKSKLIYKTCPSCRYAFKT